MTITVFIALLILAALSIGATRGSASNAPLLDGIRAKRVVTDHARAAKCLPAVRRVYELAHQIPLAERRLASRMESQRAMRALSAGKHRCYGLTYWAYLHTVPAWRKNAWFCIHRGEGSWTAATGNGYYGGLQMDLSFQRSYGGEALRRWGTANNWPWYVQILVSDKAYRSGRGFYPWPTTARNCGLI